MSIETETTASPSEASPLPEGEVCRMSASWSRGQRIHFGLLVLGACCVIGARLDQPRRLYFDEKHYVPDAIEIWDRGTELQRLAHPPWGKILIGAGIELFGDNPVGWRIASAASGVVIVASTYLAARSLTQHHNIGLFAGMLVMLDGLVISMSRIAMLDVIAAAHVMAAFVLIVEDRNHRDGHDDRALLPRCVVKYGRVLAAALLGAAVATKWSAVPALAAMGLVVLVWDLRRTRTNVSKRSISAWVATFVVLPVAVYVAAHTAWIANYDSTTTAAERCTTESCPSGISEIAGGWVREQTSKIEFQRALIISHPYRSEAIGWPVLLRPVLFYNETCSSNVTSTDVECEVPVGQRARILGLGNVVLWWGGIAAAAVIAARLVQKKPAVGASALVLALAQWLPWTLSPNPGFLFYMTPVVPFTAIMIGAATASVTNEHRRKRIMGWVVAAALIVFVIYYPIWTGLPLRSSVSDAPLIIDSWR